MSMTTPFISPSRFHGLPWESWTNSLGRTSPIDDKPLELKQPYKNKTGAMKLPKKDMKIFGLCPERDSFTVVVCETCNTCVKPQALLHHFELRHMNKDIHPSKQIVSEIPVPEKTVKVLKSILKNPLPPKVKTKKPVVKETSKRKEGLVNTMPSLPVSLTLEAHIANSGTFKGDLLKPKKAVAPLASAPVSPAAQVLSKPSTKTPPTTPTVLSRSRRPPRKYAPIKEREYDPDKHCGVVTTETLKPCTWSLTCKSHPMSHRRAVVGRSKPFDQLLADHRHAKEVLLRQKKNQELQNSSVMLTPPSSQPSSSSEQRSQPVMKTIVEEPKPTLSLRLPELSLDVTPTKRVYLSSSPQTLLVKSAERSNPPLPPTPTQQDFVAFTFNHPKALNVSPLFSNHKIGGLVYTNRRMQIARHGLDFSIQRANNSIFMGSRGRNLFTSLPLSSMPCTLSSVLNNISSRAVLQKSKDSKRAKQDKLNKSNKKMCLSKEETNLINIQINNLKSVLSRQYPITPSRLSVPSSSNSQFHIPNILSNALKRSADSPPKTQNKKLKKKNSPIMGSVLSNHSKNGLAPSKSAVPYVRVITNGKVEPETKTLGLCETPKFANNSNKLLNESDLRKVNLRFEIFE